MRFNCEIHSFLANAANVTEQELHDIASSLEMFVDELPEMPKLKGYMIGKDGHLKAGKLRTGMFKKNGFKFFSSRPLTRPSTYFFAGMAQ